jgi:hypothetical protein
MFSINIFSGEHRLSPFPPRFTKGALAIALFAQGIPQMREPLTMKPSQLSCSVNFYLILWYAFYAIPYWATRLDRMGGKAAYPFR